MTAIRRRVERLACAALGLLFAAAAVGKLLDLEAFEETLARFGIVLDAALPAAARLVVALELAIGLGLLAGLVPALVAALGLLLVFEGALGYGLWLGLDVDCGCFGALERVGIAQAFRRNLALLALAGYLYWRRTRRGEGNP